MKRHALALLLLPMLAGCGFYGSYANLRDLSVREEERSQQLLSAAEITWSAAIYNDFAAEVAVRDPLANRDDRTRETVTVVVSSGSDPATRSITLTETSPDSGFFRGPVTLVRSFDAETGAPAVADSDELLVNADQDAAWLGAVYEASRGTLQARAQYTEPPMVFGTAVEADGVTPLPGATVVLERDGTVLRSTTARADGTYAFYNLDPGSHEVVVYQDGAPAGQTVVVNL
mgnify:CR=1 FL=1